jgi:hypothetical protein
MRDADLTPTPGQATQRLDQGVKGIGVGHGENAARCQNGNFMPPGSRACLR